MKICIVNSSYAGADSPFEKYDDFADPGRYIPKSRHEFVSRWVTKANYQAEIDDICNEGFDMYMNYMWGLETDAVAGIEATRYLESKGVTLLTNPSKFLEKTKIDLQRAADKTGLRVPRDTPDRYPKIVKYTNSCGSLKLDEGSVCHDQDAVKRRVAFLQQDNKEGYGVMVQDYVVGAEYSAMVVEMGSEVVALTPLEYIFPDDTPPDREFLTWYNKFDACEKGEIRYAFVDDDARRAALQQAAVDAFKAIGGGGGGAWARVDLRLEGSTGLVYVIEVNPVPVVFYPRGNTLGDDLVVEERFPGGHAAFFDTLLATKHLQLGRHLERTRHVASFYDGFAPQYQAVRGATAQPHILAALVAAYDWSGTVLDLACGMGAVGRALRDAGVADADVTGVDISERMLDSPDIKSCYRQPIRVGPMQELIMGAEPFDHIICFGASMFLDPVVFTAVMARIFMLARRSVTLNVCEMGPDVLDKTRQALGDLFYIADLNSAIDAFGVPKGWRLVYKKREHMFKSPTINGDIGGYVMRYERL